jgi:host factor-I protein
MKHGSDATAVGRAPEPEEFVSRKLIRPPLNRRGPERAEATSAPQRPASVAQANGAATAPGVERTERQRPERPANGKHHQISEQTHAENFYYQKQVQSRTLMTVVLKNGETIQGTIEWYDKNCIKIHRTGKPNLLVYKPGIRYMHKSDE